MKDQLIAALRWVCVIPIAFVAAVVLSAPVHWVTFGLLGKDELYIKAMMSTLGWVYAGTFTAPKSRITVAWLLFAVWAFIVPVNWNMMAPTEETASTLGWLRLTLQFVGGIPGFLGAHVREQQEALCRELGEQARRREEANESQDAD